MVIHPIMTRLSLVTSLERLDGVGDTFKLSSMAKFSTHEFESLQVGGHHYIKYHDPIFHTTRLSLCSLTELLSNADKSAGEPGGFRDLTVGEPTRRLNQIIILFTKPYTRLKIEPKLSVTLNP